MLNIFKKWNAEGQEDIQTPKNETVEFKLTYKRLLIGFLKLDKGVWSFHYSEDFKSQDVIKPLLDFPNLETVYKSEALYPFFLERIPSTKQPKVQKVIKENKINPKNEVDLLKFFGIETISNPFSLLSI